MTKQSRVGSERFQWNKGAWLGTQLGSTVWLVLAAAVQLRGYPEARVVALSCFLVPIASVSYCC